MKKIILSLAIAFSSCALFSGYAQDTEVVEVDQAQAEVVEESAGPEQTDNVIITPGEDETVIEYNGNTFVIPTSEYENQKEDRKLPDLKIAKNARISNADGAGIGVTVMAMCIVLLALIVLSLLFMFFGKIFARKQSQMKKEAHGDQATEAHDEHDSGEVIAAIAMALDEHFNSKHDLEDTVLTIRRMKRAYSPWNSKIYNMRDLPGKGH